MGVAGVTHRARQTTASATACVVAPARIPVACTLQSQGKKQVRAGAERHFRVSHATIHFRSRTNAPICGPPRFLRIAEWPNIPAELMLSENAPSAPLALDDVGARALPASPAAASVIPPEAETDASSSQTLAPEASHAPPAAVSNAASTSPAPPPPPSPQPPPTCSNSGNSEKPAPKLSSSTGAMNSSKTA